MEKFHLLDHWRFSPSVVQQTEMERAKEVSIGIIIDSNKDQSILATGAGGRGAIALSKGEGNVEFSCEEEPGANDKGGRRANRRGEVPDEREAD